VWGALVLVTFLANAGALRAPFLWDDESIFDAIKSRAPGEVGGTRRSPFDVRPFFGIRYWMRPGERGWRPYRPVRETALALGAAVFGADARPFHLANLLLHTLNVVLVFELVRRTWGPRLPAVLAAGFFAVHPTHVEAVAWTKNIGELLALAFALASWLLFLKAWVPRGREHDGANGSRVATPAGGGPRRLSANCLACYVASLAAYGAALGAKESAAPLPALLLLWAWPGRGRSGVGAGAEVAPAPRNEFFARTALATVPFWLLALLYMGVQSVVLSAGAEGGAVAPSMPAGVAARLAVSAETMWVYVRLLAFPAPLSPSHNLGLLAALPRVASVFQIAGGLLLLAGALACRRRFPLACVGFLWTLLALGPVANLLAVNTGRLVAEQRLYTPSVGWCILLGAAFSAALGASRRPTEPGSTRTRGRRLAAALLAAMLLVLAGLSERAAWRWGAQLRFWRYATRMDPFIGPAHYNLGRAYRDHGLESLALSEYVYAAQLRPHDPRLRNNLGVAYMRMGRLTEAEEHLAAALALRPDDVTARRNLEFVRALREFERYRRDTGSVPDADQRDVVLRISIALGYEAEGRMAEARRRWRDLLRDVPDNPLVKSALERLENWQP